MIKLSPRLQMTADMVRRDVFVLDVGTDHAYLPSYLILNDLVKGAVACDLREMPLNNAKDTLITYHLEDKIKLYLSDGLDIFSAETADDIVIAGLGGNLITDILARTPWLKDESKRLIIQPMSHAEDIRKYLCTNGFRILCEDAAIDNGHTYIALNAAYTGEVRHYPKSYYYIGELPNCKKPETSEFLRNLVERLKIKAYSLLKASKNSPETNDLFQIISDIERCIQVDNR